MKDEKEMKMRNMVIGATVTALLLLWLVTVGFAGATVVKIEPATQSVSPGEGFSVDVTIEDITDMAANGAILHFEPNAIQATSIIEGDFLKRSGTTLPVEIIDNTAGTVTFAYALSTGSVGGSGPLATIQFTAAASAEGTFDMDLTDVELYDSNLNLIPKEVINGTVAIGGAGPAPPTPGFSVIEVVAVIGILAILFVIRRRRIKYKPERRLLNGSRSKDDRKG